MADHELEKVAAKLDDISETLEEMKGQADEGAAVSDDRLDAIETDVERAADAIEDKVDPD